MHPALKQVLKPEKGVYFFHYAAQCLVWPFLPLFLRRFADDSQLGLILGACRLMSVAMAPAFSWAADARVGRGPIFAGAWVCWQLLTIGLLLVAKNGTLAAVACVALARAVFEAPIAPFIDAGVLARAPGNFGGCRLFGSISWGLMAPFAGAAYGATGFAPNVALSVGLSLVAALCATKVVPRAAKSTTTRYDAVANPFRVDDDEDTDEGGAPAAPDAGVLTVASDSTEANPFSPDRLPDREEPPETPAAPASTIAFVVLGERNLLVFLWIAAIVGAGFGFVMNFLFVYVTRVLGGTPAICGMALFVECAVEVPVMHASDGLLRRHGARRMLLAVLVLYSMRCAGYAMLASFAGRPWLVLLVEPLHGITFALFYTTSVNHVKTLLPEGRETLAQGIFSAAFTGGTGVGAALGGVCARIYGFQLTFYAFAMLFVVATVVAWSMLEGAPTEPKVDDRPEADLEDDDFDVDDAPTFSLREYDDLGDWATPGGDDPYDASGL